MVNSQLALTSFALQGTNLTILAVVPPGLGQVTLEIRPTLIAPWEAVGVAESPAGGGYDYELEIGFGR